MTIETTEVVWLEARGDYTIDELAALSGLPSAWVEALVDCGALPSDDVASGAASGAPIRFRAESIRLVRAARRLSDHFELEGQGLAVAVSLLRRVLALESELARLRGR